MPKEKQVLRKAKKGKAIRQVAAIPVRRDADGHIEILLITSSTTQALHSAEGLAYEGQELAQGRDRGGVRGSGR